MPGPLANVDTQVEAPLLDLDRQLSMGSGAILELRVPDSAAQDEPIGMRLIRQYDRAFNRIVEDEEAGGTGRTIIFRIADFGFPEGQVLSDVAQKDLHIRWWTATEGPFEFCKVNEVVRPTESEGQVYTLIAQTRTFKKAFFPRS